jgi:hypothetical protein
MTPTGRLHGGRPAVYMDASGLFLGRWKKTGQLSGNARGARPSLHRPSDNEALPPPLPLLRRKRTTTLISVNLLLRADERVRAGAASR